MKKVLFSVLVVLVVLWSCSIVLAQGRGADRENKQAKRVQEKAWGRQSDAYERRGQAKGKRMRGRKQLRKKERGEIRETRRKGKGKSGIGSDVNQPAGKAGKGKGLEQQQKVLQKKIAQERAKHMRRTARLKRIGELAKAENKTDMVKRVNILLRKEQERYIKKQQILTRRAHGLTLRGERRGPPLSEHERELRRKRLKRIERRMYGEKHKSKSKEKKESTPADSNQ